ncbi:MAG: methyltransferase, TIGR04325 family [Ketobacteraceae bacterium]|nr:methyltransferase, TIGR04325 family [Ketobacteraceae bacterium]
MRSLATAIKVRIRLVIEILPFGRDIFLWLSRARKPLSYRGVFATRSEALTHIPARASSRYDEINKKKARNAQEENAKLDVYFRDYDYPAFFWLTRCLNDNAQVLELGGSLGHYFYSCDRFDMLPESVRWTVAELPEAVKLGSAIARERQESRLSFLDSEELANSPPADVFLTAGTLQYMESPIWGLLDSLNGKPRHLIVHNLPAHRNRSFWTLQNLSVCEVPYRIYSHEQLLQELVKRGYELVKEWGHARDIEIPFHRQQSAIEGYLGFYFRLAPEKS